MNHSGQRWQAASLGAIGQILVMGVREIAPPIPHSLVWGASLLSYKLFEHFATVVSPNWLFPQCVYHLYQSFANPLRPYSRLILAFSYLIQSGVACTKVVSYFVLRYSLYLSRNLSVASTSGLEGLLKYGSFLIDKFVERI